MAMKIIFTRFIPFFYKYKIRMCWEAFMLGENKVPSSAGAGQQNLHLSLSSCLNISPKYVYLHVTMVLTMF